MSTALIARLHNWGAWARQDSDAPSRSCIAGFWSKWTSRGPAWDEGWGEQNAADAGHEQEIDEVDAERIDCWVRQLASPYRTQLIRRYVHGHRPNTPSERQSLNNAIDALGALMGEYHVVVRRIKVLLRGA